MTESTKCAHQACKCLVPTDSPHGKYCSEHCKEAVALSELKCDCKHPGCR
jgi:hypothetical protein